ncbi:TolC family protein [Aliivibrio fischeri]|uniref:TolC family protein n=1 Tax=Aliivibrio fischeri TaxID=668 RepID=UPI0012D94D15|nr:TolC family protein [Aliivibrio fischeri]MUK61849.1 TolC family protein [Aliivibrio fischeri]MUK69285.1 TolC family protein [Aliivibrio fischeri]MUK75150.1 TolC family protein [Aliivibrio fischeri]MUK75402.1 TolC family protein [Aliivibrio fischeri]MUL21880.1 TolC family protein [Aliivibrio fischeri]
MLQYKNLTNGVFIALALNITPLASATTLLEAVTLGLENNLSLRASNKGIEESENNIGISRSKFLPSLNGAADTTWNENETLLIGETDSTSSYNSNSYSLSLAQTLFNLSDIFKYGTAKLDFNIEEIKHQNKMQNTISEIAIQYFEYLKNNAQIKATKVEFKSSETRTRQMQRNVDLGNTAASELYEVIAQKEGVANRLRTLQKDRRVILNSLSIQIQYPITPSQDIYESVPLVAISESEQRSILEQALRLNNDLLIAKKTVERSRRSLKESGSNFLPTVSLSASYRHDDTNNYDRTDPSATGESNSTNVKLNLAVPILSGGSDYYSYQKSSSAIDKNELLYQDSLFSTRNDVNNSILNINDYSQSIESYENIIRANYSSYKGIQRAYQLGTRTITDLLSAESKLFSALRDYENARYDYIIEVIKLEQIKGILAISSIESIMTLMSDIEEHNNQDLVPKHLLINVSNKSKAKKDGD